MPKKKNRRKQIQAAKRDQEPKARKTVAHIQGGAVSSAALALAVANAFPGMIAVERLDIDTQERD